MWFGLATLRDWSTSMGIACGTACKKASCRVSRYAFIALMCSLSVGRGLRVESTEQRYCVA